MFAIISNGVIALLVPAGTAFKWGGIQYPQNWCNLSSPKEKAAIGMVDVVYGARPNDQYYWVSQNAPVYTGTVVEISYTATPKDLVALKEQATEQVNQTAYAILLPSDWMVTRAVETSVAVPIAWSTWRDTIRSQARAQVAAITACTSVAQLAALPSVQWAQNPDYIGV